MWSVTSYYSAIMLAVNSFSGYFLGSERVIDVEFGERIEYRFPDSRIAAANAIVDGKFGKDFLFGVGTAAYQIEGAWNESDKTPSVWDDYLHNHPEVVSDGTNGDVTSDSYHKYKEDIQLVKSLGADVYRISLAWPRILPNGFDNYVSPTGIEFYNDVINEMLRWEITPVVTIYHWDLPKGLQDLGGWTNPLVVDWFVDYARVVFQNFGDRVKIWTTMNEPGHFCKRGYGENFAPGIRQPGVADYLCGHHAILAHAKAYRMYKKEFQADQNGRVGIVISASWPVPENKSAKEDVEAASRYFEFMNGWILNPIFHPDGDYPKIMRTRIDEKSNAQGFSRSRLPVFTEREVEMIKDSADYLGVNFYFATTVRSEVFEPKTISYYADIGVVEITAENQKLFHVKSTPWAFELLLRELEVRYKIPMIYIAENGYNDDGQSLDIGRTKYYHQHLLALMNALHRGIDVRGYFAWSLIDNFEWLNGFTKRYGLFHVDFEDPDRRRTRKLSAELITDVFTSKRVSKLGWSHEELSVINVI